jgi:hypothetical protein
MAPEDPFEEVRKLWRDRGMNLGGYLLINLLIVAHSGHESGKKITWETQTPSRSNSLRVLSVDEVI